MNDYFSIGYNFFKSNNFKKAAEYFNNYIDEEKNDDKTDVHYYLSICYNHLGDKNKFLEYSQVSLLDNKLKKSYKINLHNKLFNFYLETRNFNQAQIYL
jgi:tetratricopeptide (TPR) repeat protein